MAKYTASAEVEGVVLSDIFEKGANGRLPKMAKLFGPIEQKLLVREEGVINVTPSEDHPRWDVTRIEGAMEQRSKSRGMSVAIESKKNESNGSIKIRITRRN